MADITITHTSEDGTLLTGSAKGDGVYEIVRAHGFRWFPSIRMIGIRGSRDHKPMTWKINAAKTALEAAGHTVTLEVNDGLRSAAEREEAKAEQLETRQDALEAKASRRAAEGEQRVSAGWGAFRQMDGQPILVGHYSEKRHRNAIDKAENNLRKGYGLLDEAKEADRRADASRTDQSYRETGPVTERRIAKLEAERRKVERDMAPCMVSGKKVKPEGQGKTIDCRLCWNPITLGETVPDHGRRISQAHGEQRLAELDDELAYWREHLQELVDSGRYRKWGPDDFQVGDYVSTRFGRWSRVEKVNRKTLSVPSGYSWLDKIPFDEVRGKRTKEEQEA